ncbi:MAG: dihydroorotate dehydrogenase electron transfer subunit [Lachnospiraceae bacterium]|nr:dihydroorotate dehydrogenase electron transfer subunit [Lachnospiraceae bacterium]
MSEKFQEQALILSQQELAPGIYSLWIQTEHIAEHARPGQFLSLYCEDGSRLLPRPISICEIDRERNALRMVYRIAGKGTEEFSGKQAGDTLRVTGPLGNGYPLENQKDAPEAGTDRSPEEQKAIPERKCGDFGKNRKAFLVGGGIGIPPLLELAKQLDCEKQIIFGYRDSNLFLLEDFLKQASSGRDSVRDEQKIGVKNSMHKDDWKEIGGIVKDTMDVAEYMSAIAASGIYIATEDGSVGTKGNVLDAIRANALTADVIYACGPTPMLRALKAYAQENDIECWISLEEKMACGIGACLACVCKSVEVDGHTNVHNKRICKEGPVFDAREVEL